MKTPVSGLKKLHGLVWLVLVRWPCIRIQMEVYLSSFAKFIPIPSESSTRVLVWLYIHGEDLVAILNSPLGISVSEQGTIGVCDSRNDRIQFFEIDGTFLMEYHDHVHYPVSIAFIHTNNVVIAEQDNIQVRNSIGQILYLVGSSGVAPGMLSSPMGLSTTTKGNIFVCDTKNHRVQVFSKYGRLRCTLGENKLKFPFAISVLPTGEIYVLDTRGVVNGFRIFLAEKDDKIFGITIFHFLEKKEGEKVGGIAVSENGDLALSIYTKNKVVMYKNYNINKLGDTDDKLTITKYMDSTTNQILDGNVVLKLWIP